MSLNTFGADDPDDLLAHAEAAMYQAKRRGGFGVETFGESLRIEVLDRMATEHSLHRALERSELMLHYQPVVEVRGATTVGRRGADPVGPPRPGPGGPGPVHPGGRGERADHPHRRLGARAGLPPAAGTGTAGARRPDRQGSVEVNLSARQIDDPQIVATVEEILSRTGLPPEHLTLEITESALMKDAAAALVVLRALKELGVLLAIDDFGTGYSSLSYLQRFPLDILKVDRMFVQELGQDGGGDEIVSAVISAGPRPRASRWWPKASRPSSSSRSCGRCECDFAQGFLFSRPVPAGELRTAVRTPAQRLRPAPHGTPDPCRGRTTTGVVGPGRRAACWSGRPDLNRGPPAPKAGALPSCATPRRATCRVVARAALTSVGHGDRCPPTTPAAG